MNNALDRLAEEISSVRSDALPPVHLWNPPLSGDIDIRIDREGRWYHKGCQIERAALVKLFSRILKREGNDYFLVTPVEKWRIQVDIAPLYVISAERVDKDGRTDIHFTTSTDDHVVLGAEYPLLALGADSLPAVRVRDNIEALLSRPVYYQLVGWADIEKRDGSEIAVIRSGISEFVLGAVE